MIFNKTAHKDSRQQSPPSLCAHDFCQIVPPRFHVSMREQLCSSKHDCTTPAGLLLGFRLSYRTISIPYNQVFCNGNDQYSAMIQLGKCKTSVNMRKFIYGHLFRWLFPRSAAGSDGFREDVTVCFTRFWLSQSSTTSPVSCAPWQTRNCPAPWASRASSKRCSSSHW